MGALTCARAQGGAESARGRLVLEGGDLGSLARATGDLDPFGSGAVHRSHGTMGCASVSTYHSTPTSAGLVSHKAHPNPCWQLVTH